MKNNPFLKHILSGSFIFALVFVYSLSISGNAYAVDESSCKVCHSKNAVEHEQSIHAELDVTCVTCHGGDPGDPDRSAMDPDKGFKGNPSRLDIPDFCSSCHAESAIMAQYGLDVHQLDDYKLSDHGKALYNGDTNVAVCTDCHGKHRILSVNDPRSGVSHDNLGRTCAKCHSDSELMDQYGLPSDAYKDYINSVHAKPVHGATQATATCADCHSSHGATKPEALAIQNVCSQCHSRVRDYIKDSPHHELVKSGVMSCESCHGYHAIKSVTEQKLLSACVVCHERNTTATEVADSIYSQISTTRKEYNEALEIVDRLEFERHYVQELRGRLEEGKMGLLEAARDIHTFDPRRVEERLVITNAIIEEVHKKEEQFKEQRLTWKVTLIPVWLYIIVLSFLLYWKKSRDELGD